MNMADLAIIILAGGSGTRIGGDKAHRLINGDPIITHVLRRLPREAHIMISGDAKFAAELNLGNIPDETTGSGPLGGLLPALRWAASSGLSKIMTVPCDAPFLPFDLAPRLEAGGAPIAIAASNGQLHPTIGLWLVEMADSLADWLGRAERRSMQAFLACHEHRLVEWPAVPYDPFFNVNTPFDLALASIIDQDGRLPEQLDVEGLKCPLPAIKTGQALERANPGASLMVSATDPLAIIDIPHLVHERGDRLLAQDNNGRELRFLIEKHLRAENAIIRQ